MTIWGHGRNSVFTKMTKNLSPRFSEKNGHPIKSNLPISLSMKLSTLYCHHKIGAKLLFSYWSKIKKNLKKPEKIFSSAQKSCSSSTDR